MAASPTRLLLTRHGQTVANAARRFSGHSDVALTPLGRQQARALGRRLRDEPVTVAYASDLARARETAELALRGRGIPVVIDAGLRELSFGAWEGKTFAEVRAGWPDDYGRLLAAGEDSGFCAPGASEGLAAARLRVVETVLGIAGRHASEAVLISAHGGTLQMALSYFLGMPSAHMFRLATGNCGLNVVELYATGGDGGARPLITLLNDLAHVQRLRPRSAARASS